MRARTEACSDTPIRGGRLQGRRGLFGSPMARCYRQAVWPLDDAMANRPPELDVAICQMTSSTPIPPSSCGRHSPCSDFSAAAVAAESISASQSSSCWRAPLVNDAVSYPESIWEFLSPSKEIHYFPACHDGTLASQLPAGHPKVSPARTVQLQPNLIGALYRQPHKFLSLAASDRRTRDTRRGVLTCLPNLD